MNKDKEMVRLIYERIRNSKIGKIEIEKEVVWNWDALWQLSLVLLLFPLWIREVKYFKKGIKRK